MNPREPLSVPIPPCMPIRKGLCVSVAVLLLFTSFFSAAFAAPPEDGNNGDNPVPSFECKKFDPPIFADKSQKHKDCVSGCQNAYNSAVGFCNSPAVPDKWKDKCLEKSARCLSECKSQCPSDSSRRHDDED